MDTQLLLVVLIVMAAAVYLTRSAWRGARGGCASACGGCAGTAQPAAPHTTTHIPIDQLTLRRQNRVGGH
jgi:hypothetical protein